MNGSKDLWLQTRELNSMSAFLMRLAEVGSDRLTIGQAAFFMLAAAEDAKGKPATRTKLLVSSGAAFRPSTRNSYRQLMAPSRVYPRALDWLNTEENPLDSREQFLRLTPIGREVIESSLAALGTAVE